MKTWKKQIENWINGIPLKVPSCPTEDYSKGFYYQTSCCDQEMKNPYKHVFKKATGLPEKQDISKVKEYLENPKTPLIFLLVILAPWSLFQCHEKGKTLLIYDYLKKMHPKDNSKNIGNLLPCWCKNY